MGSVSYLAYKGSWKSGDAEVLTFPNVTTEFSGSLDAYKVSVSAAKDYYGDSFESNWTCFTFLESAGATISKDDMYSWGMTNVIAVTEVTNFYISESAYIQVNPNGAIEYYKNNTRVWFLGTVRPQTLLNYSMVSGSTNILTFTNYTASKNIIDIWGTFDTVPAEVPMAKFFDDAEPYEISDDPYDKGGTSGEGGGTGTFSGTSDSINFPGLPTLSATSTGFITLFNPTIAEMQSLATYMWSDVFDIGLYKTLFADPMDCILGCSIVPVAVPNGGTKTVNVGNVSTGISMTVAASQYVEVDCGTLNVEEFWGSYLDYDPYTKAEIYLPYCGTHALQVDDIMGKAVHVKYHVDILSGACCAYVKCGGSVMYSFVGQCSSSIPISANDWTNVVNGALTIAASVGSLIATGGASAPMAVGAAAAVTGTIYGGGIKQNVEKSGSMGGTGGMLAVQTPYLILTRPRQALPKKQNTYTGYPSFITTKLSDLKGYTEIDSIRITGVPATDAELNELESILKSGVIF